MTVKEIWESKKEITVHCNNEEEEKKLFAKLNELNYKWIDGRTYDYEWTRKKRENDSFYKDFNCYTNDGTWKSYSDAKFFQKIFKFEPVGSFEIVEFADVDDFKKEENKMIIELNSERKQFTENEKNLDKEALRKRQKQEALKRMDVLNLLPEVKRDFKNKDTLYYSESLGFLAGILYWVTNHPEYVRLIQEHEHETGDLVYHAELSHTSFGDLLTLLYVSKYESEWPADYRELKEGYPFCYVINLSDGICSEYGSCHIIPCAGGVRRVE